MKKITLNDSLKLSGTIRLRSHPAGTIDNINDLLRTGRKEEAQKLIQDGTLESETKNLIMTNINTGRDLIVQWLLGIATYPVGINWGAIGTSNTAVSATDSQLGAEVARTSPSFTQDYTFNEAILQFFFPDSVLTNTTYKEFGTFVNGTNVVNSGQIFNHALLSSPFAKSSGMDVTVEVDILLA